MFSIVKAPIGEMEIIRIIRIMELLYGRFSGVLYIFLRFYLFI